MRVFRDRPEVHRRAGRDGKYRKVQAGNAPFRNIRLSQGAQIRAHARTRLVLRLTQRARGTGRYCRERKSYPRVTRALRNNRKEPDDDNATT